MNLTEGKENKALAPEMQRAADVQAKALSQMLQEAGGLLPRHCRVSAAVMTGWGESPCQEELARVGLR